MNAKIGIILQEPFPIGMAATNRVLSYAEELAKRNIVKVYIPVPTEYNGIVVNKNAFGEIRGVFFSYIINKTEWPSKTWKVRKLYILTLCLFKLVLKLKKDNPDIIIFYCIRGFYATIQLFLIKLFWKGKLLIEESEYPKVLKLNTPYFLKRFILKAYKLADGMIVMTNELLNYYAKLNYHGIFILPMTVDLGRFENVENKLKLKEDYFAYVGGNGGFKRDGLIDSLRAFNLLIKERPSLKYFIIGPIDSKNENYLEVKNYVIKNKLSKKVIFLGSKSSEDIPNYMTCARALVMTPPKDFESGGFPTKLGEYLASGRPVVVTDVSGIGEVLNHTNSFITPPKDYFGIYLKFKEILDEPKKSNQIGQNGKIVAQRVFGANNQVKELERFLLS